MILAVPMLFPASGGAEGGAPTFGVSSFNSRHVFPHTPGLEWVTNHHIQALVGAILVIAFWVWMSRGLKVVPGKRQFVGEKLYSLVRDSIARDALGHDFDRWKGTVVPFLVALFSFILINNLFGEFFVFMFPTFSKIGFAYGLAVCSFILYNAIGLRVHGLKYFSKMTIPPGVPVFLWPLIIPLEFLSNFITRPITLALRLWANLFAGHLVILVLVAGGGWLVQQTHNVTFVGGGTVALVFSFAVFALELLVAFLQAYIFTILTAQYVASSVAEEH